jgi:hypothetical protein
LCPSKRSILLFLFTIMLASPTGSMLFTPKASASESVTTIKVDPARKEFWAYSVGQEFTVAVRILDVTNLYGFDLRLGWNTTILECVSHSVRVPKNTYADGILYNPAVQIKDQVDATEGTYVIAYASSGVAPSFNGSGTVFTMTFKIIYQPVEPEPFITILRLYETDLSNPIADPIAHTSENGTVAIYKPKAFVDPSLIQNNSNTAGKELTIAVKIINVTGLYRCRVVLRWNTTILDYVQHSVRIPEDTYPDGVLKSPVAKLADDVYPTDGMYEIDYLSDYDSPAPSFNGSGTVFTMTFSIKHHPIEPEPTVVTKLELEDIQLWEKENNLIPCTKEDGTIVLYQLGKSNIKIEPAHIEFGDNSGDTIPMPGTEFTVDARIYNVTNLYSFNLKLRWNTTFLRYMSHSIQIPRNTYPDGVLFDPTQALADSVNLTTGTYWLNYSSLDPAPSFNGSGTIFNVTFEVIKQPFDFETGGPDIDCVDTFIHLESADLTTKEGQPISHYVDPAIVRIWERLSPLPPTRARVEAEPSLIEFHENSVNRTFTVAVKMVNVTNLYGFDIRLRWNTTFLEYVNHTACIPRNTYADGSLYGPILPLENVADQTTGIYWIAYSSIIPAPSFNGSGTIFVITFRVKHHPLEPEPTVNLTLELYVTELADRNANSINHDVEHCTVTLYQIPKGSATPADYTSYVLAGIGTAAIIVLIVIYISKIRKPKKTV